MKGLYTYGSSFLRSLLLKKYLNSLRPDVLVSSFAVSYGFYGALSNYSPSILLVWGSDVLVAPKLFPLRFVAKYALKKAGAVITDSQTEQDACVSLGCDPRKIVRFPWTDLGPLYSEIQRSKSLREKNRQEFRKKLGWSGDDLVIVSTRWHEPVYDVESLIQAIPQVIQEVENARFLILGSGKLTEELIRQAQALKVKDYVRFLGRIPQGEMAKYLTMSDIYVSTSLSDGTSASLLEAMACQLVVVVTDIPANREWLENGKSGELVPRRDPASLAKSIVKLLKDGSLRRSMSLKAYSVVQEKADWEKNSQLLDDLILSMAKSAKK
jgi:glycosyltransferase involved in cell wall biosynthesis